ncbi:hypothetical protein BC938DRAFT_476318 [Jimgerdemannia flammicorona]|uniref:Zn(2)-C6 fungal-type domain-containing protein n=1 Tax=Jimgerdemannia flammicorona TaxID=994334 RepID=A0A433PI46_9FUNG|nr:hypothetical protein BC938DRAFT_476318 [Jimgerdemannia flammicorona]
MDGDNYQSPFINVPHEMSWSTDFPSTPAVCPQPTSLWHPTPQEAQVHNGPNASTISSSSSNWPSPPRTTPVFTASGAMAHSLPILTATLHVPPYSGSPTLKRPRAYSDPRETISSPSCMSSSSRSSSSQTAASPLMASLSDPTNLFPQALATPGSSSRPIKNHTSRCSNKSIVPQPWMTEFPSKPDVLGQEHGQLNGLKVQLENGQVQPRKKIRSYGPRTTKACNCCRKAKTKCSGDLPCRRCARTRTRTCNYGDTLKLENDGVQHQLSPNVSLEQDADMESDESNMQDGMYQVAGPVDNLVAQLPSTPPTFGDRDSAVVHMVGVESAMDEGELPMDEAGYIHVSLSLILENEIFNDTQPESDPDPLPILENEMLNHTQPETDPYPPPILENEAAPTIFDRRGPAALSHSTRSTTRESILKRIPRAPPFRRRLQRPEDLHRSSTLPARSISDQHLDDESELMMWSEVLPPNNHDEPFTLPLQRPRPAYLSSEDKKDDNNGGPDSSDDSLNEEDGHHDDGGATGGGDGGGNSENLGPSAASYSCRVMCNVLKGELPPIPSQLANNDKGDKKMDELGGNRDGNRIADCSNGPCSKNRGVETSFVNGDSHLAGKTWVRKITGFFWRGKSAGEEKTIHHLDQNNENGDDEQEYVLIDHTGKDEGNVSQVDEDHDNQANNIASDRPSPASLQKATEKEKAGDAMTTPKSRSTLVTRQSKEQVTKINTKNEHTHDPTNTRPPPTTIPHKGLGKRKLRNRVRKKLSSLKNFLRKQYHGGVTGGIDMNFTAVAA